jgi:hypothetical protein
MEENQKLAILKLEIQWRKKEKVFQAASSQLLARYNREQTIIKERIKKLKASLKAKRRRKQQSDEIKRGQNQTCGCKKLRLVMHSLETT